MSYGFSSKQLLGRFEESRKGRKVDALAHGGDEGRDKLRKVTGRSKYPLIRQSPNGTTQQPEGLLPCFYRGQTRGTETS